LLIGYANAQNFCDIVKSSLPSVITCTGTGAKAELSLDLDVAGNKMSVKFAQSPCKPASASLTITDASKKIISSGTASISIATGTSRYPVPGASFSINTGVVDINAGVFLDTTISGGIDDSAGLGLKIAVSVCNDGKCNSELSSVVLAALPISLVDVKIPKSLFKDSDIAALCPPPKASSSEQVQASLILAAAAAGVAMAF
jgi:hypothetical protein